MKNRLWNKIYLASRDTAAPPLQPGNGDCGTAKDKVALIPTPAFPDVQWTVLIGSGPNANIQAINEADKHA